MEMLLGRARPSAVHRGGGDGGGAGPTAAAAAQGLAAAAAAAAQGLAMAAATQRLATAAAVQGLVAAAASQGLGPPVAACMCVAEGAGKATWRKRARRHLTGQRSGAGAQDETCRCLDCGLC